MAFSTRVLSSRSLRAACQRSAAVSVPVGRPACSSHLASLSPSLTAHRCSSLCLLHHSARSFAASASASSPNPLPASSSGHTRSPGIGNDSFHPADPEVEGYKTRLTVERRVHRALTSLPKLKDNATLQSARPPQDDVRIDWWPLGHDDPLAVVRLDSLDLDSLDKVELLTAVEKEFDVEFNDAQYEQLSTVGDIIETLLWNPHTK